MAKKRVTRKRYSPAEKQKILSTAAKEGLTGQQAAKKFGISTLTFYRWRGPVGRGRKPQPATASTKFHLDENQLRLEVRGKIARALPQIIQEEIAHALANILGAQRKRGRPRTT